MPETISYDPNTETLHVGEGQIRPVPKRVWEYEVSGMKISENGSTTAKRIRADAGHHP